MEKLSRVKKYENLRKQIDLSIDSETESQNSNRVDPVIFKKIELTNESPKRERELSIKNENEDTFVNEYMDDLIRDIKQYNRQKGLVHSDITEVDILNQLKNPTPKREDYVKTIEEEPKINESSISQSKKEIAMQIQELLNDNHDNGMNVSIINPDDTHQDNEVENDQKENLREIERLNEQTQKMKIKMEKHEEEMNELSEGIDKTNRLLNILLIFLIIALLLVIGFTIFVIMKNSGRI